MMVLELMGLFVKSGILTQNNISEIHRWGVIISYDESPADAYKAFSEDLLLSEMRKYIDTRVVKEVDMNLMGQYEKTLREVDIHVSMGRGNSFTTSIFVGKSLSGEYILPYVDETFSSLLDNGESHIIESDGSKVFFGACREVYADDENIFILCKPSTVEVANHGK